MEHLLHYVWKHKLFPLKPLCTTNGTRVEVIDTGLRNTDAGPDFFNAKMKMNDMLWVGNVEIHTRASDWFRHGHDKNRAYDSVVLHVVGEADAEVRRTDGSPIPQLVLEVPEHVRTHYRELCRAEQSPACAEVLHTLPAITVHSWLSALQAERLEQKAKQIAERLQRCGQHWEDAFFITLARNYGFGLNGDAFEACAWKLPFRAMEKHRDNLFQVEAFFFGQAGLLNESFLPDEQADDYAVSLRKEHVYLTRKFPLAEPMDPTQWNLLRLRPDNFPHVRLAQLANLYHRMDKLFSRLMEAESLDEARNLLATHTSEYWETHYLFGRTSPRRRKAMGGRSLNLLIVNTVVPFLYAYGRHKDQEALCRRAEEFLEKLPAEDNRVIRMWNGAGLTVASAADSQALLQLSKNYCDQRKCLFCRFGYEYLRPKRVATNK